MLRFACALIFWALLAAGAAADTTALPGLIRAPISVSITLPEGRQATLEGLVIRPDRSGRLPLVILVHGSPISEPGKYLETYRRVSPTGLAGPALAFAQHGYAAVSIMRRGFGRSDGPYAEFIGDPCDNTDYLRVGLISAEDISGAVASLRREAWVDPGRIILLGNSTGGLASVATGAGNPPGVVGAINFAGGRGAFNSGSREVCSSNRLVDAFATFGRTAKIPELWLYTENDQSFSPALAQRMFDAYTAAGAPAQLLMLPPYGKDGHLLLTAGSSDLWWPQVASFLASLHLPTSVEVQLPPPSPVAPPQVNDACVGFFRDYVAARTDAKAFVVNPEGHCGFNVTARSLDEAKAEAMKLCSDKWSDCRLYAAGQQSVGAAD
jgi:dienelactone hydrolase